MIIIIPGVYLAVIWVYVIPLIVDRRMSLAEAMSASKRLVDEQGFWNTFAVLLVLGLIAMVVSFVPFSQVVVYPWLIAAVLAMYFVATGEGALLPSAVVDRAGAPGAAAPPVAGLGGAPMGANPMPAPPLPAPPLPAPPVAPGAPSPSSPDDASRPPAS